MLLRSPFSAMGSPPRSRGIHRHRHGVRHGPRLTPAFAGNTPLWRNPRYLTRAHPRVRGEYIESKVDVIETSGSPPRSRGIRPPHGHRRVRRRLTPAFAGNTCRGSARRRCTRAHPRVRGEYVNIARVNLQWHGSPPRSRGIQRLTQRALSRMRLTPAFAGNTTLLSCDLLQSPAHPRVRGEYDRDARKEMRPKGSPPRSRGIPVAVRGGAQVGGLTPAFAGNTTRPTGCPRAGRAHPRVRGEYPL